MSDLPRPTEIDQTVALEWLRYSFKQGDAISAEALEIVQGSGGRSCALLPETVDLARLANPNEGGVIGTRPAQEALMPLLNNFADNGAACVVIEDELRRRSDPDPSIAGIPTAFVHERVLHWAALGSGTDTLARLFYRGSHGYPLNAFVTSANENELGLVDGADLNSDIANSIVKSLVAVIVAAYDAETFIIWEPS